MDEKRIYELDRVGNTQDAVIMIDVDDGVDANSTALTYHVVSTLPATGVDGWVYHLDTVDGLAPIGTYTYFDGWVCLSQVEVMELPNWSNDAIMKLISGASYTVFIAGNISLVAISLSADGTCSLVLNNPSLYTISTPVGIYSTTIYGLDAISHENVRVSIQRDDGYYEWCTTDRININGMAV